jgi:CheY-like chemotaxis protein
LRTSAPTAYRDPHQGEERCRYQRSTVDPNPIRVLVVDDHFVVRTGVRALLHGAADITVAGEAANGLEAVAEARRLEPQVILMDLMLPLLDGVEAIRAILAAQPDTGIIVLTGSDADALVLAAVEAGALGYLAKSTGREDFLDGSARASPPPRGCGSSRRPRERGSLPCRPSSPTVWGSSSPLPSRPWHSR